MHFPPPRPNTAPRSSVPPPPRPAPRHAPPPARRPRWGLRLGILGGITALTLTASLSLAARYLPSGAVLPGLTVDGVRIDASASAGDVRAIAAMRAKTLLERKIAFSLEGKAAPVLELTLNELGARVDVDRTTALALRVGKDGDLLTRAEAAALARDGRTDVPLFVHLDREVAMARFAQLKETLDTQPVSARIDLDKHETIPEKDGRYIDADGAIAALELALRDSAITTLSLPVKTFGPRVSASFLSKIDISSVVAEYETFFSRTGDQQKRGKNIDNAASKLDGLVISPGELASFNEIIGERSEANGFEKSWEIFKGEMVEGVGGGTCQVASTFHAATFFGGFEVLERLPHSRPSAYIPMGLDSTVVYPAVDLKVRNPHPFPVVVHAKTIGGKLRIELLGKMRPLRASFGREVLSTLPYKRKVEEDPALYGKKVVVKQHGIQGFKIKVTRELAYPDGTKKKEELTDTYPPTTEIYKVPVGFDVALLPPLPDADEDPDLGGNPSAAPPAARTPSAPASDAVAQAVPASDLVFVDAPGAHAPTAAQREPPKTMMLRR